MLNQPKAVNLQTKTLNTWQTMLFILSRRDYFWPCQQKDTVFWGFVLGRVHAGQGGGHSSEKLERKNKSKRYKLANQKGNTNRSMNQLALSKHCRLHVELLAWVFVRVWNWNESCRFQEPCYNDQIPSGVAIFRSILLPAPSSTCFTL